MAASRLGARLFRQNTGMGWIGKSERVNVVGAVRCFPGDVIIRKARPFHAGFEGLADTGGWVPVTITADMVGKTVAVYLQVEVKDKQRTTEAQMRWINAVNKAGGVAGVARSEIDLEKLIISASNFD